MRSTAGILLLVLSGFSHAHDRDAAAARAAIETFDLYKIGDGQDVMVCEPTKKLLKDMAALDSSQLAQPSDRIAVCASAPPPQIAPFGDATYYVLTSDLRYRIEAAKDVITIPAGFVTDLASIPRRLWSFGLPRDGQYLSAAILHDYLYWDQRCKREEADLILLDQMDRFGVGATKAALVYNGVRLGGQKAWDQNSAKKNQEIRVIPNPFLSDFLAGTLDASQSWATIQQKMKAEGLKSTSDPGNPNVASTCQKAAASPTT